MTNKSDRDVVVVPSGYPCSMIYVDESAAKESAGSFFTVAAVKVRQPGKLSREIKTLRDETGYVGEFKFNRVTRGKLTTFYRLIDLLEQSGAHIAACVVDRNSGYDAFSPDEASWVSHARVTAKLLVGIVNRRELSSALIDERSTPTGCAFDDTVRAMVNHRLRSTALVSAVCVDSMTHDGVQLADLVAGAVSLHARHRAGADLNPHSHKAKVATRLASAFGVSDLSDTRTDRVNVMTLGASRPRTLRSVGRG